MLPSPATTRWSSSATLIAHLLAAAGRGQRRGAERRRQRLGAEPAQHGVRRQRSRGTRSIRPNRRGSLKVTIAPDASAEDDVVVRPPVRRRAACSTRKSPDMPRCTSSVSPDDSDASRYLARRVTAVTRWPTSRSPNPGGKRDAQVGAAHFHAVDADADQRRLQHAAHRLDFGQLGHSRHRTSTAVPAHLHSAPDVLVSNSDQGTPRR